MTSPESPARGLPPSAGEAMLSPAMDLSTRLQHRQTMQEERLADIEKMSDMDKAKFYNRVKLWWGSYSIEFRELLVFILFLVVYTNVMWGPKGIALDRFMLKSAMARNIHPSFTRISTVSAWYNWLELELVPNLYSNEATKADPYAAVEWPKKTHFDAAGVNRRIGTVRVRLLRAKNRVDLVSPALQSSMGAMYPDLSYETYMDTTPYALNMSGLGLEHADFQELKWRSGIELGNRGFTYCPGTGYEYSPSGYVVDFPPRLENATRFVQQLRANSLVDLATRAALVEYAVYNANTDEFGVATLVTQFLASGMVLPEAVIRSQPLLATYRVLTGDPPSATWTNLTFLEMAMYVYVMFLIVRERVVYKAVGAKAYFGDGFAYLDCLNYALFLMVLGLRFNLMVNLWYLSDDLQGDRGYFYINMTKSSVTFYWTEALQAFNCIVTFVKLFKYLRPIPKLALFTETLRLASGDMMYMCVVIMILLLGFGSAFNLGFGPDLNGFSSLDMSLLSLFRAILGDFDLDTLLTSNLVIGAILFIVFIFVMYFVTLSMFLSIVDEAYDNVRAALDERTEQGIVEPLDRDLARFRRECVYYATKAFATITGLKKMQPKGPPPSIPVPQPRGDPGAPLEDESSAAEAPGDGTDSVAGESALRPAAAEASVLSEEEWGEEEDEALESAGGLPAGTDEFIRRRNEVSLEVAHVAKALAGAFGQLNAVEAQQAEMLEMMRKASDLIHKKKKKADEARAAEEQEQAKSAQGPSAPGSVLADV